VRGYELTCPQCGETCGKYYPNTYNEPGFFEGRGENFIYDGMWFCSEECMDKEKAEREE